MFRPRAIHLTAFIILLCCTCGCTVKHAIRLKNRQEVDVKTMISEVTDSPLVFVGEHHDVPAHHRLQFDVIKGLRQAGKHVVIGVEMFEFTSQRALDAWVRGTIPENSFIRLFQLSWRNMPWSLYEDIFDYAREQHITILGLNAPRDIVQRVSKSGFESLSPAQRDILPPGATDPVTPAYLQFIGSWYPTHGREGESFRRICEAQALRNRVMAAVIRAHAARHPESTMVVVAGAGHARHKGGVPMELPDLQFRIIVPPLPGMTENASTDDADYLLESPSLF